MFSHGKRVGRALRFQRDLIAYQGVLVGCRFLDMAPTQFLEDFFHIVLDHDSFSSSGSHRTMVATSLGDIRNLKDSALLIDHDAKATVPT